MELTLIFLTAEVVCVHCVRLFVYSWLYTSVI